MPIIVLTKKNLLIGLLCAALVAGGVFLWLRLRDRPKDGETAEAMASPLRPASGSDIRKRPASSEWCRFFCF